MTATPLGDQALLIALPDEAAAVRFSDAVRNANPAWLQDVVPAYRTVGVYFEADRITTDEVARWLKSLTVPSANALAVPRKKHRIPVCYDLGPDLDRVAEHSKMARDEVVALHTGREYTVFAIGFVPGFPYLGYLPEALCGVPRLASPRVRVEPGSVGLTGRQTGIYPLPRPGGWSLIGRTPLTIVDVVDGDFPIRVGETVRFHPISQSEFGRLEGTRL